MSTLGTLRAARALIADESRWLQGKPSQGGARWDGTLAGASKWCTWGAVGAASGSSNTWGAPCWMALSAEMDDNPIDFNDSHTHAEVLAAFDRAIAAEEAKQAPLDVPLFVPSEWTVEVAA